jgi:hypothetical protein
MLEELRVPPFFSYCCSLNLAPFEFSSVYNLFSVNFVRMLNRAPPSQPLPNYRLYLLLLRSMEGATLAGKLAAQVVAAKAKGLPTVGIKPVQQHIIDQAPSHKVKPPPGVKGEGAIAFGAGAVMSKNDEEVLKVTDPEQLVVLG